MTKQDSQQKPSWNKLMKSNWIKGVCQLLWCSGNVHSNNEITSQIGCTCICILNDLLCSRPNAQLLIALAHLYINYSIISRALFYLQTATYFKVARSHMILNIQKDYLELSRKISWGGRHDDAPVILKKVDFWQVIATDCTTEVTGNEKSANPLNNKSRFWYMKNRQKQKKEHMRDHSYIIQYMAFLATHILLLLTVARK